MTLHELDTVDALAAPGVLARDAAAWAGVGEALSARLWIYRARSGALIKNVLSLLPNGEIANHDSPDERTWSFDGSSLTLHRADGIAHVVFDRCSMQDGRILLEGVADPHADSTHVVLESRCSYERPFRPVQADLLVELSIWRPERPMVAMFNGGGTPFNERGASLDFYRMPSALGVDCIRFSEHERHFARYLDKIQAVQRHLEYCLTHGHRRIVLFGFSASGYACILLAERLAERYPELTFATVLVNAQTALDPVSDAHLTSNIAGRFLSPIWGDWTLDVADLAYEPIAEIIGRRRPNTQNVQHLVLYDSGNPAERYHSTFLADLPGVELRPINLGMGHADGITEMFRRGDIEEALAEMINAC